MRMHRRIEKQIQIFQAPIKAFKCLNNSFLLIFSVFWQNSKNMSVIDIWWFAISHNFDVYPLCTYYPIKYENGDVLTKNV